MTVYTEGRHPGEGLLSEANFHRSRENIVIAAGSGVVAPNTVLGKITVGAPTVGAVVGTGDGTLTMDATTPVLAAAKVGDYVVTFTSGTAFGVVDPDGNEIGDGVVGTAFANQIKFAIAAGSTAFEAGDTITVSVAAGSGQYAPSPDGVVEDIEGAEVAVAINLHGCDATSTAQSVACIARDAEWSAVTLNYDASVDDDNKKAEKALQLKKQGIILR